MKIVYSLGLVMLLANSLLAQTFSGKINGSITETNGTAISGVTIRLRRADDTTFKKYTVSTNNGNFSFAGLPSARYIITCTAISYQPYKGLQVTVDGTHLVIALPVIILQPAAGKSLKEVMVTASKPLVEHSIDRTIVNVDAMLAAVGSNALEVLGKSPGVYVDPNGNVSLNGRGGVLVLIDDKPTYLSAKDLAAYLRSLPGGSLAQIELMINPPAKYDAAGSAIINIKLKKNRAAGFNGNLSTSFNAGQYFRSNDALNLNYRSGKYNVFGNISYSRDANFSQNNSNRDYFGPDGSLFSSLAINSLYIYHSDGVNLRTGIDYYVDQNTTLGVILFGGFRPNQGSTIINNNSLNVLNGADSTASGKTNDRSHWYNGGVDLNFQHQLDQHGQSLSVDLDHIRYHTDDQQYTVNKTDTGTNRMRYTLPSDISIYSAKADYTLPLGSNAKFETGLKSSWVTTDNHDKWFSDNSGLPVEDFSMSDHFIYTENINAVYISAQKPWKRWGIKGGLRMENTRDFGHQLANPSIPDSSFRKNYYSLFPSFYLSYKLDSAGNNTLGFMYSTRVHRPSYQQLNPFLAYQDQYTYTAGNPFLNPNFYQIYQVSYAYKQFFDLSFAYINNSNNVYTITTLSGQVFITRPENFAINNSYNLHADINLTLLKGWDINASGLLFHLVNNGEGYGTYIHDAVTTGELELFNSFHLDNNWSAEINGSYRGPFHGGQTIAGAMWFYNFALQRKLFNGNGSIRLRADNLFHNILSNHTSIGIHDVAAFSTQQSSTSLAGLSFQYSFGKVANARRRSNNLGAEDEQDRAK